MYNASCIELIVVSSVVVNNYHSCIVAYSNFFALCPDFVLFCIKKGSIKELTLCIVWSQMYK